MRVILFSLHTDHVCTINLTLKLDTPDARIIFGVSATLLSISEDCIPLRFSSCNYFNLCLIVLHLLHFITISYLVALNFNLKWFQSYCFILCCHHIMWHVVPTSWSGHFYKRHIDLFFYLIKYISYYYYYPYFTGQWEYFFFNFCLCNSIFKQSLDTFHILLRTSVTSCDSLRSVCADLNINI